MKKILSNGEIITEETEGQDFYYNHYEKIVTWRKNYYHISAKTKEEADEAMINFFKEEELTVGLENEHDALLMPRWCDCGDYYEGDEDVMTYEENNGVTEELFDEEGNLLETNEPIEVRRQKKLNTLLQENNK